MSFKWNGSRRKKYGLAIIVMLMLIWGVSLFTGDFIEGPVEGAVLLVSALLLWTSEVLPMSITTMFMICLLAMNHIMTFDEAIANIGVSTSLFIMASSGITIAVACSGIPRFLTAKMMSMTAGNSKKLVIGLGFLVSICSAFMSSLATCALFNGILLSMLQENGHQPGKSNLGKSLMIMIPACAGIGGFMSPAGTPANVLLIDMLKSNHVQINFAQWCLIGFPIGLLAVGLFLCSLVCFIPPEAFVPHDQDEHAATERLTGNDKKTAVIVLTIIVLWFLSSWIRALNTTMIAMIGLVIMFLPCIELMEWKKFSANVNWDLVLTMGTVSVFMTGIAKTGLMHCISSEVMRHVTGFPLTLALIMVSMTICVIRSFVPTTTAVVALLAPMLIEVSVLLGTPIECVLFILAFWTASALLVVHTEPIYLITYSNRYYSGGDLLKVGVVPCLILSVLTAILIPVLVRMII